MFTRTAEFPAGIEIGGGVPFTLKIFLRLTKYLTFATSLHSLQMSVMNKSTMTSGVRSSGTNWAFRRRTATNLAQEGDHGHEGVHQFGGERRAASPARPGGCRVCRASWNERGEAEEQQDYQKQTNRTYIAAIWCVFSLWVSVRDYMWFPSSQDVWLTFSIYSFLDIPGTVQVCLS